MNARPRRLIPVLLGLTALVVASGLVGATEAVGPAAAYSPEDELAATPPMGFNNWNDTFCLPEFNEAYVKATADIIVSTGLKDAGYEYVNLDDCWARPQNSPQGSRDADGHLVPDPVRFPNGIDAVADYVHSKGLKLGIYTDAGTRTCNGQGFDGLLGPGYTAGDPTYERIDAQDFADWGVDYVKMDWCNVPLAEVPGNTVQDKARFLYTGMSDAMQATGRPMVLSIATLGDTRVRPWEWGRGVGQLGRTTGDIRANYASMSNIAKFNLTLADFAGPGYWNDPDMLQIGNAAEQGGSWSPIEQRTHFSLWATMAAPLLIGTDLRNASRQTLSILRNRDVIAVDQDPLGVQGDVVRFDEVPGPSATRTAGQSGFGNAIRLNGPEPSRYVALPTGIVSDLTDVTISAWVNRASTSGQTWSRIFDFGTGTDRNMFLTVNAGGAGVRFAITDSGSGGEQRITAAPPLPIGWQHVAVTLSGDTGTLYVNGQPVATNTNLTLDPASLGETTNNWIGRSQYADPDLDATVDDVQIYDHALSQAEIQALMASPGNGNVAAYHFDEAGGNTVVDSSGNGRDGTVVTSRPGEGHYVIAKPLEHGEVAVVLWNDTATQARITTSASEVGPPARDQYLVRDLWSKQAVITDGRISAMVPAHGSAMFRVTAVPPE